MRPPVLAALALLALLAPAAARADDCVVRSGPDAPTSAPATGDARCALAAAATPPRGLPGRAARVRVAPAAAGPSDTLPLWPLPAAGVALVLVAVVARHGRRP